MAVWLAVCLYEPQQEFLMIPIWYYLFYIATWIPTFKIVAQMFKRE